MCRISKNTTWKIETLGNKDLALWVINLHSKCGKYETATFESENFAAIKIIELKEHYMPNYELVKILINFMMLAWLYWDWQQLFFLQGLYADSRDFMWIFTSHLKILSDGRNVSQKKKGASTSYTHGNSYSKL